jgi:Zn-dependent M28 family amino/carboxypeptidase
MMRDGQIHAAKLLSIIKSLILMRARFHFPNRNEAGLSGSSAHLMAPDPPLALPWWASNLLDRISTGEI